MKGRKVLGQVYYNGVYVNVYNVDWRDRYYIPIADMKNACGYSSYIVIKRDCEVTERRPFLVEVSSLWELEAIGYNDSLRAFVTHINATVNKRDFTIIEDDKVDKTPPTKVKREGYDKLEDIFREGLRILREMKAEEEARLEAPPPAQDPMQEQLQHMVYQEVAVIAAHKDNPHGYYSTREFSEQCWGNYGKLQLRYSEQPEKQNFWSELGLAASKLSDEYGFVRYLKELSKGKIKQLKRRKMHYDRKQVGLYHIDVLEALFRSRFGAPTNPEKWAKARALAPAVRFVPLPEVV